MQLFVWIGRTRAGGDLGVAGITSRPSRGDRGGTALRATLRWRRHIYNALSQKTPDVRCGLLACCKGVFALGKWACGRRPHIRKDKRAKKARPSVFASSN